MHKHTIKSAAKEQTRTLNASRICFRTMFGDEELRRNTRRANAHDTIATCKLRCGLLPRRFAWISFELSQPQLLPSHITSTVQQLLELMDDFDDVAQWHGCWATDEAITALWCMSVRCFRSPSCLFFPLLPALLTLKLLLAPTSEASS